MLDPGQPSPAGPWTPAASPATFRSSSQRGLTSSPQSSEIIVFLNNIAVVYVTVYCTVQYTFSPPPPYKKKKGALVKGR